jgi:hypothetical protein
MTVIDSTRSLFQFFTGNDVFNIDEDFAKVVTITLNDVVDRAIIRQALQNFQDQGVVVPLVTEPEKAHPVTTHWALTKPLVEYAQTVELSFPTVHAITNTINEICDELEIEKEKVNPLQITEQDIVNLILIISRMRQEAIKEDE